MEDSLSSALFGKTRRLILALFLDRPEESYHLREVVRLVESGHGAVQRELKRLADAGILRKIQQGNQTRYQANPECPIFPDLQSLLRKTAGMADVLREALAPIAQGIDRALVFGSMANGTAGETSDVDVFLIGKLDEIALHRAITSAEKRLGRTINYTLMTRSEFARRKREHGGFVSRVLEAPRIEILGVPDNV